MRGVDTNVLVRLIARDDPNQVAAAETFVSGGAWVSLLVLAETIWVLDSVYERTHEQLAVTVEMLLAHEQLSLQEPDVVAAALDAYKRRKSPGFSDCLILEIARKSGNVPLGTFDRGLAKLDSAQKL